MSRTALADRRNPWRLIEVRHLTALAAIAREGTLGEAALSLGYVQSAVSGQLAKLEWLVGAQLVERSRGHGSQELTPAGSLLLAHSEEILLELQAARAGIAHADEPVPEGLRIGVAPGLADGLVGPVLARALDDRSALEIGELDTVPAADVAAALLAGDLDVALVSDTVEHDEIAVAEIGRYRMVLAIDDLPRAFADRERIPIADLATLPLVAWREGEEPSRVERELEAAGVQPHVVARADGSGTALALAVSGRGAAIVPSCAITADCPLATVPLDDALPARFAGVAWARDRARDARVRRFVALACALRAEP